MVLEAFGQAIAGLGNGQMWLWLMMGIVGALIVGILPGIGAPQAMAILLSFVFRLEPMQALPLMVAVAAVSATGGSITAVLLGIPGDVINLVTVFDGFPMTKRGEAARAIGIAIMSSILGGTAPVFLAIGMVIILMPILFAITSMDMFFIILIGLSFVVIVGKGGMAKGLISGGIGILISTIGLVPSTGAPRFTFDLPYLYEGIRIIPAFLGLFAVPPLIELGMAKSSSGMATSISIGLKGVWQGIMDVFHHTKLWVRSSLIGYIFGVITGAGVTSGIFISYGLAKRESKTPELFGTGMPEGVIASEACNNAKESGALLTTMTLGIPSSVGGALQLGALMILGFSPGPSMIKEHLDLAFLLLMIVAIANIIGGLLCLIFASPLSKIANIPGRILVPLSLAFVFVSAFVSDGSFEDVVTLLIFVAIGLIVIYFGFNPQALVLGMLLGTPFERYLFIGVQAGGALFFLRPISLFLIACLIALFAYGPVKALIKRRLDARKAQAA